MRSIAKVRKNEDGENEVVNNNFTSLVRLPEWTADSQTYLQQESAIDLEEETEMYTDLSFLNSTPLGIFIINWKLKLRAKSSSSDARYSMYQPAHSRRQLSTTIPKKTQSQMVELTTLSPFTNYAFPARMIPSETIKEEA